MLPTFIGLFLLGIVLGEAFLETGTVYLPIGLHADSYWAQSYGRG